MLLSVPMASMLSMSLFRALQLVLHDIRRDRAGRRPEERLELAALARLMAERTAGTAPKYSGHQAFFAVLLLSLVLPLGGWNVATHIRVGARRP